MAQTDNVSRDRVTRVSVLSNQQIHNGSLMFDLGKRLSWNATLAIMRPASGDELLNNVTTNIWKTGLIHLLADRLADVGNFDQLYTKLAQEIFAHLSHDAHERQWGDHPRERWIKVVSRSAKNGIDRPRPFHTDEAGLRHPAAICLMYAEKSALGGGGNRFLGSDVLWTQLLERSPSLAWRLVSHPVEFQTTDGRLYAPIIRRRGDRTFINFNEAMVTRGRDVIADDMVARFRDFLMGIDESALIDISLRPGDAIVWWDELFLHARENVIAGAEVRKYHKVGIALKPAASAASVQTRKSEADKETLREKTHHTWPDQEIVYTKIWREAEKKRQNAAPLILGIDGVTGAGKTTLAIGLCKYLKESLRRNVDVVHVDQFHFRKRHRYADAFGSRAFYDRYFDYDRLIKQVLLPLKTHGELRKSLTFLDLEFDEYTVVKACCVSKGGILVIEGNFLFRQPICDFLDYRILCDVPITTSLSRVMERRQEREWFGSVAGKFFDRYLPASMRYRRTLAPQESVDMIVDTTDYRSPRILTGKASRSDWPL